MLWNGIWNGIWNGHMVGSSIFSFFLLTSTLISTVFIPVSLALNKGPSLLKSLPAFIGFVLILVAILTGMRYNLKELLVHTPHGIDADLMAICISSFDSCSVD